MKNNLVTRAVDLANRAHRDHVDKIGLPYILHPLRVMTGLAVSNCEVTLVSAVLHDTVEDTWVTLSHIRDHLSNFGHTERENVMTIEAIVTTVDALTHREDETYREYILRAAQDKYAPKIKVADIVDNLTRPSPPDYMNQSLYDRYINAVVTLEGEPVAQAVQAVVKQFRS